MRERKRYIERKRQRKRERERDRGCQTFRKERAIRGERN